MHVKKILLFIYSIHLYSSILHDIESCIPDFLYLYSFKQLYYNKLRTYHSQLYVNTTGYLLIYTFINMFSRH